MKEQILAVQRMQDYINEHLNEEITLENLSQAYASNIDFVQYVG